MAKQISISDEVYETLLKMKEGRSFSEVIKSMTKKKNKSLMQYAGMLKHRKKELKELEKQISEEREKNHGRKFEW
ncbi:MAG: antitoxin VapB family protein [Candidatus Micrarchaeales archaeon]